MEDTTNYRFYKFYKSCGDACDLEIRIDPLQIFASLELLVSLDKGDGKLPTRANYPQWSIVVNQALILDIPAIVINSTNMT